VSLRAPVDEARVTDTAERIAALRHAESDLRDAGAIALLTLADGEPGVEVALAPAP